MSNFDRPLRNVTDVSLQDRVNIGEIVSNDVDYSVKCQCAFCDECKYCEDMKFRFGIRQSIYEQCLICECYQPPTAAQAAVRVMNDLSVDEDIEIFRLSWARFLVLLSNTRQLKVLEDEKNPFDSAPDTSPLRAISLANLVEELKRPTKEDVYYLRCLFYELLSRKQDSTFVRYVASLYSNSMRKLQGLVDKQKRSSGSRRAAARKKSEYFVPKEVAPLVVRPIEVPRDALELPKHLISDLLTPERKRDVLMIGEVQVESRAEFSRLATVFARNKGLFLEILSSPESVPLSSFQARIFQKLKSDGNFRHKLERFIQHGQVHLQMFSYPRVGAIQHSDELEGEDSDIDDMSSGRSFADFRDYIPRSVLRGVPRKVAGRVSEALRRVECEAYSAYCDYADNPAERQAAAYEAILRTVNGMARVAVTVDLIMKAETKFQKLEILFLYLSAFDVSHYLQSATEFFASGEYKLQGSAMDDFLSDAFSFVGISHVLSQLMGAPLSGMDFLRDRLRNLSRMKDGDMPLRAFWAALKRFVLAVGQCFAKKSLDPLFAVGETPEEVLFEAESLITYRDNVTGLTHQEHDETMEKLRALKKIPSYWTRTFLGDEYIQKAQDIISKLDLILPVVPTEVRSLYLAARAKLFTFVSANVNSLAVNGQRLQPLGVALVGPPGVGKTNFTKLLYRYLGLSRGFSTDASGIYNWKSDVNFQDGLNPGHWVIVGDDLDLGEKPCTAGVANHVDAIMGIVDNKPFPVESAAVDLKGTNFARPLLYLHCTNNKDLRLTGFTRQYEAIYRRLPIMLEVAVLPEFSKGAAVDTAKAHGHVDIHSIKVMEFDFQSRTYLLHGVMTTTECLRYLKGRFDANLAQQQGLISQSAVPSCKKCMIPVRLGKLFCAKCSEVQLQGQGPSAMTSATKALENFNEISEHVKKTDLINRVDRLTADVSDAIRPTLAVNRAVATTVQTLGDFIAANSAYLAVATGLAAVIGLYLSREEFQGRINNSTQTVPSSFVRVSDVKPLGAAFKQVTFTQEELKRRIRDNLARVFSHGGNFSRHAYALRVGLDSFVANKHMIEGTDMELQFRGLSYKFSPSENTVVQIGTKDLVLIKVPGVPAAPTCLPMFWVDVDLSYSTFDSVYLVGPDFELSTSRNLIMSEQLKGYSGVALESDCPTEEGHCGLPMVAQVGSAFRIVGLHHSHANHMRGFKVLSSARAPVLCRTEIELASTSISASLQSGSVVQSCFPKGIKQQDLNDPMCSELALALERDAPVVNLGHDENSRQSSVAKSKCVNSVFYDRVEPFCRELTQRPHYWQVPHMKGKMIEGQWHSGFQNIFKFYKNPECYDMFYAAILDYVAPLRGLDTTGYSMLSLDEAVLGVESSVINPLNFQTSVGPPFSGPKSQYVTQTGHMSPELLAQIEEVNALLADGQIPIVMATCTLKDEPVKATKNEVRDIRVFNNICAALNIVTKQYFAPIQAFMRANAMCVESMVGIDMSRDGGQRIMERASIVNPALDNSVEGDFEKMDKTIGGCLAWAEVEVYKEIASILGLDVEKVALLAWADFHIIYSIQGDLFQFGGNNPSGSQKTVENNAIANSLAQRAAWFKYHEYKISIHDYVQRIELPVSFRSSVVLVTYGDDFLIFMRERINLQKFFSYFRLFGMKVTDAKKLEEPVYRSFWDVDFLKRRFRLVDGYVRSGLDMKSIFRMLMIARPTTLSRKEQSAIVLEEALREIFLNVDPEFELWRGRFRQWADELRLWDSKYLQLETAAYYESLWQNKVFSPWVVPSASMGCFEDTNVFQSKMSASINTTSAVGDDSASVVTTPATTNLVQMSPSQVIPTQNTYGAFVAGAQENGDLSHASGTIVTLNQPIMAGSVGNQRIDQRMADTHFGDSLLRDVHIANITDFSATAVPTVLNPWDLWTSNTFVSDKLKNFQFIRGSLVLHGVLRAPPLAAGVYCITCLPYYQQVSSAGAVPSIYSTVPLHAIIDLSNSSSFELTLPWCVSSNWGNLLDLVFRGSWWVTCQVLSPILTAVPSGCVTASLSLFCRPGPDFELSGAKFESGRMPRGGSARLPATIRATPAAPTGAGFNMARPVQTLQESVNQASISAVGMKPSDALKSAGSLASKGAGFPMIGSALGAASSALSAAGAFAAWLGFTRDTITDTPVDVIHRSAGNMINCDGGDSAQVSALFSTNAISTDPAISGSFSAVDESSLAFIHSRYCLIGALNFVVGDTTFQDQVFPVTPCFGKFNPGATNYYPTTTGYTAGKFVYWRGDVKYIFYPVVSPAHRGALQIIWQPVPPTGAEPADLTNISLNAILDLGAAKPYEITVGYNNDNPMASTDFYAMDSTLAEADYTTLNGYIRVRAITPITGSVCGQTIQVLVFQAGGENLEFGLPTEAVLIEGAVKEWGKNVDMFVQMQSGTIGAAGQSMTSLELVPSSGPYPVVDNLLGEKIESYRALMQKPSIFTGPTANPLNVENRNFGPYQLTSGPNSTNWFTYFGTVFLGYAGSVRERWIMDNALGSAMSVSHIPLIQNYFSLGMTCPLGQVNPISSQFCTSVDALVPYQHNELFVPAYTDGDMSIGVCVQELTAFQTYAARYYSGGPDMRITMFRCPNTWFFPSNSVPLVNLFHYWGWNQPVGAIAEAAPLTDKTVNNTMSLDQYRARTGRKEWKTTGRLYVPPVLPISGEITATQS